VSWLAYLLPYLPPLISIYLISISGLTTRYLKHLVSSLNIPITAQKQNGEIIEDIALDWGERLGFLSAMIVALFSSISISSAKTYDWAILTLIVLMIIFTWMLFWIIPQGAGDLVTTRTKHLKLLHVTVCHIILWIVNIVLIAEIAIIQILNPPVK
jgi:hypothetical protein